MIRGEKYFLHRYVTYTDLEMAPVTAQQTHQNVKFNSIPEAHLGTKR